MERVVSLFFEGVKNNPFLCYWDALPAILASGRLVAKSVRLNKGGCDQLFLVNHC